MAFIEHTLAALAAVDLTGAEKLVTVGLFSGVVRLFAQTEISQRQAGQDTAQWQNSLAGYLLQISPAASTRSWRARWRTRSRGDPAHDEPLFDRAMTRILTGLLPS